MKPRAFASPADAAGDLAGLMQHSRALAAAYLRRRLTPHERELVMVAVSRVNACQGCTLVHQRWALGAGASDDELRAMELGDLSELDARSRAAVVYATARAEARFRRPPPADVVAAAEANLTTREIAAVEAVARAMTIANLSVSTSQALMARVRRSAPGAGS